MCLVYPASEPLKVLPEEPLLGAGVPSRAQALVVFIEELRRVPQLSQYGDWVVN